MANLTWLYSYNNHRYVMYLALNRRNSNSHQFITKYILNCFVILNQLSYPALRFCGAKMSFLIYYALTSLQARGLLNQYILRIKYIILRSCLPFMYNTSLGLLKFITLPQSERIKGAIWSQLVL